MRLLTPLLLGAALIGAAAPGIAADRHDNAKGEAKLAKALAGRTEGKPVNCINMRDIRSTQIIDGTAIIYDTGGGQLYVNRPSGHESLDSDDILVSKTYSSQLCSLDTVKLVDRGARFERGFVGLNQFVPYTKPRPAS